MAQPPLGPRSAPTSSTALGDDREDPWYWLRDRDDPEVLAYLEAENAYTEEVTAPLGLARDLFEEIKARIEETDMSVPVPAGPVVVLHADRGGQELRHPLPPPGRAAPARAPRPASRAGDEQVLLDENALAEGPTTSPSATAAVSPDHRWLAYGTDTAGDERYELRFRRSRRRATARRAEAVPDIGYGLAWSERRRLRLLHPPRRGQRPYQLWRHRLGTDPAEDILVFEEADERFPLGAGRTKTGLRPDRRCTAPTPASGWPSGGRPDGRARRGRSRREGVEYAVDHLRTRRRAAPAGSSS